MIQIVAPKSSKGAERKTSSTRSGARDTNRRR
jgi:hypothetical protein